MRAPLPHHPAAAPPPLQAKYGDDAERQLQERKVQEAALAADKLDVNLIPLGTRVGAD